MKNLFLLLALIATPAFAATNQAVDEYTFNLGKPPEYARAWFATATKDKTAREAGPGDGLKNDGFSDLVRKLAPNGGAPAEQWAAYYFAYQQCASARLPNFKYLNALRKSSRNKDEVYMAFRPWSFESFSHAPDGSVIRWALSPPSIDPRSKQDEVKKLNRYIARLAAHMLLEMKTTFDPEYKKHFVKTHPFDPSNYRSSPLDAKEAEALRLALIEDMWQDGMIRTHMYLDANIGFMKSSLCALFRSHLPGDKESIREILIEAGYKTVEERKAYWEFCRTEGANWARWAPKDEERLVTE